MSFKQRLGLGFAPIFVRLALGVVFLWAGSSKLFYSDTFSPEQAATLANIGIVSVEQAAPEGDASSGGATDAPIEQVPMQREPGSGAGDTPTPSSPSTDGDEGGTVTRAPTAAVVLLAQHGSAEAGVYTAADFPDGVRARRLNSLALLLHARAFPAEGPALWPSFLSSNFWLTYMPWLAAIAEFGGAIFVLIGLLTRLASFALVGTMLTAMLLTTVGPAAIADENFLGFLPPLNLSDSANWVSAWDTLLLQLTTGVLAASLLFTGAGWLSLDQRLFTKKDAGKAAGDA